MKPQDARNRADLIAAFNSGSRPKYVFFWGHTPPRDGTVDKSCFSQWFSCRFTYEGKSFATAEHYMMYKKALLFSDMDCADKILAAKNPGAAKALGRSVKGFDQAVWNEHCFEIVVQANVLKFKQNDDLSTFLNNTKKRVLVEASPKDTIWGIGLDERAEGVENPANWRGQNLLGFALMEARSRMTG